MRTTTTCRTFHLAATITIAASLAACASRQVEQPMTAQGEAMHFENLDRTGDRKLTPDELPTDHQLLAGFGSYDLDSNGELSEYEFGEYLARLPR